MVDIRANRVRDAAGIHRPAGTGVFPATSRTTRFTLRCCWPPQRLVVQAGVLCATGLHRARARTLLRGAAWLAGATSRGAREPSEQGLLIGARAACDDHGTRSFSTDFLAARRW